MAKNNEIAVQQHHQSTALIERSEPEQFTMPPADIYETPEAFVVMLDMPGASKDTISVHIARERLVVRGPVTAFHKENASLLFNEIPAVGFYRAFNLGKGIDQNDVDAHFEDGVLTITLRKKEEMKPKEIHIK